MNARVDVTRLFSLLALALAVLVAGCSDDASSPPGELAPGDYVGLVTGASDSGSLALTLADGASARSLQAPAAGPSALTGSLTLADGTTIPLTGSYDPSTGAISLSGGGYTFTGSVTSDGFSGTFSGPNGSGSFTVVSNASGGAQAYCGAFSGDATGPMDLLVNGATASGLALPAGDDPVHLTCSISGANIDCSVVEVATASTTGTLAGTTWTGTFMDSSNGKTGNWSAGLCP